MGEAKIRKQSGVYGENAKFPGRCIIGVPFPQECITESVMGMIPKGFSPSAVLFQIRVKSKIVYSCISGGVVQDNEVLLTEIGYATVSALFSLPISLTARSLYGVFENGQPAEQQIRRILTMVPDGSAVAFFGDVDAYLDSAFMQCIEVTGSVHIKQIAAH